MKNLIRKLNLLGVSALGISTQILPAQDQFKPWDELARTLQPNTLMVASLDPRAIDFEVIDKIVTDWIQPYFPEVKQGWAMARPLTEAQLQSWIDSGGKQLLWSLDPTTIKPTNPQIGLTVMALPDTAPAAYQDSIKAILGPIASQPDADRPVFWIGSIDENATGSPGKTVLERWQIVKKILDLPNPTAAEETLSQRSRDAKEYSPALALIFRWSDDYIKALESLQPDMGVLFGHEEIQTLTRGVSQLMVMAYLDEELRIRISIQSESSRYAEQIHHLIQTLVEQAPDLIPTSGVSENLLQLIQLARGFKISSNPYVLVLELNEENFGVIFNNVASKLQDAKATAFKAVCVNNCKQLGLAYHLYADKYKKVPESLSDLQEFIGADMVNYCPNSKNDAEVNKEKYRYQYIKPSKIMTEKPSETRILYCPHHHTEGRQDGSVIIVSP